MSEFIRIKREDGDEIFEESFRTSEIAAFKIKRDKNEDHYMLELTFKNNQGKASIKFVDKGELRNMVVDIDPSYDKISF